MGDERRIVVIVEDDDASRTALLWSLHNLLRHDDVLTLLHVYRSGPPSSKAVDRSKKKKKQRSHRLRGFQLALSFKDTCNNFPNAKIEIVVSEGDEEGATIVRLVRQIGASTLVVGLHDRSFLYRLDMGQSNIASNFNCKVVAISQPTTPLATSKRRTSPRKKVLSSPVQSSTNFDFSLIQISSGLRVPDIPPPKIPYRICPDLSAIIWRSRKTRRRRSDISSP